MATTTVHLMRHGEVFNPEKILYGRIPGYHLSELGHQMAQRVADHFAAGDFDVTVVTASPLQRAQETATPIAGALGLELGTDERLIEAGNYFEGKTFGVGDGSLRHPEHWPHLINPFRPSWGEAYKEQVARMHAAVDTAREQAEGHEAVLVSHQLPIWIARQAFENKRLWHDPRKRQCSLASVTSLRFDGDKLVGLHYTEPAADLLPGAQKGSGA
ncbi:Broad specificity phosphatase PhoE [Sanguibacter gelidistatuariae]|uniref:Broad specificity phosphatase PhoE n=1 Tax=Sanguibacter gelidistatuariae TaxID=1814289 RepID=A0A1G6X5P7_9MICO|nr:histidine phosphatase family protein [Sanguibacter gelidistatuariae]SDD72687.1 Broad specificity phosphatase PhoE [Sanguibacter gelidistatuariae]